MAERVRIGTRGSPLALRQAELVAEGLRRAWPGLPVELVPIRTSGDRLPHADLAAAGGKGLFVKEIDEALLERRVRVAVHSLKDLPAGVPGGLVVAAFPEREDPRDVLVSRTEGGLAGLPPGARIGTGSLRRRVQLLARRPDLTVEAIRGNVETRLRKLREGPYDAVVLAAAGLRRLGLDPSNAVPLGPDEMLPAVGQGTLAVETRADDAEAQGLVAAVDHAETRAAATAERAFLAAIGGACTTPLAAHGRLEDGMLRLDAFVATPDGVRILRDGASGAATRPEELGRRVAERMLARGAAEILRAGQPA
ncbi:MAG: hydroxymethylbilane synthase [Candidatus Rokubacteria bacterium]|nr:hydroxymethylbilane synthase [Candidatus Rokubacteria bacterium]